MATPNNYMSWLPGVPDLDDPRLRSMWSGQPDQTSNALYQQSLYGAARGQGAAYDAAQDARGQQQAYLDFLRSQMMGQGGPSLAQQQLQAATDQNIAAAQALIGSQRGMNPAAQQRAVLGQAAAAQAQAGQQSAMLRAQEQQGWAGMYGSGLGQARGQDIGQQQASTGQMGAAGGLQNQQNLGYASLNAQTATANADRYANAMAQGQKQKGEYATGALNAVAGLAGLGLAEGGVVPGAPEVDGDDERNDKVPALLSPGEIVVPREAADDPDDAKAFVEAVAKPALAKNRKKPTFKDVLAQTRALEARVAELEQLLGGTP